MHRNGQFPVTLTGSPGRLANKTKRLLFIYLFAKRIISGLLGVRIWLAFSANVSTNEVIRSCGWRLTQQPCWASRAAHRYFKQWPALYSYCHTVNTRVPSPAPGELSILHIWLFSAWWVFMSCSYFCVSKERQRHQVYTKFKVFFL